MTEIFKYLAAAGVLAMALGSVAQAQPAFAEGFTAPPVPANLDVEDGNILFLKGEAKGTQNYVCLPTATGFSWTFFSPTATLFFRIKLPGGDFRQQIITHFLSPNPDEANTPRATWQSSFDTSAVWGRLRPNGSSTDTNFVAPGAIPWLVLDVVGTERGPAGGDLLAHTTFIQRLNTSGGIAPSTGCSAATNVGAIALVPYTADYFFYKAARK
jgi:hypothetical protein